MGRPRNKGRIAKEEREEQARKEYGQRQWMLGFLEGLRASHGETGKRIREIEAILEEGA